MMKLFELGVAVPQVMAHRVARMALTGPLPNERDRREFMGMVAEKPLAFAQSWMAMLAQGAQVQQQMIRSLAGGMASPRTVRQASDAASRLANAGLAPLHRKAVSNARRLARIKAR